MRSGIAFSSILLIWIVAVIIGVAMFLPEVMQSFKTAQNLQTNITITTNDTNNTHYLYHLENLTSYTPLGIFEQLGF